MRWLRDENELKKEIRMKGALFDMVEGSIAHSKDKER